MMILKCGVLLFATLVTYVSASPPICICNRNMEPVCGSNGVTYDNECLLRCAGAPLRHQGECQPCSCSKTKNPVCGSDGRTYTNDCELNCAVAEDSTLTLSYKGPCQIAQPALPCYCATYYLPVCGSDGKTYDNHCQLACANIKNPSISLSRQGICQKPNLAKGDDMTLLCACNRDIDPVCGTNGKTYNNKCELECATILDSTLRESHKGPCSEYRHPMCICPRNYDRMCGSDGNTYDNLCALNCSKETRPNLSLLHEGACIFGRDYNLTYNCTCFPMETRCSNDRVCIAECTVRCAYVKIPLLSASKYNDHEGRKKRSLEDCKSGCESDRNLVCGTDGVSYLNPCYLQCAGQQKKSDGSCPAGGSSFTWQTNSQPGLTLTKVEITMTPDVPTASERECQLTNCGTERNLVCGANNKSYLNPCFLKCAGQEKKHDGSCPLQSSYTIVRGPVVVKTT